ncbi:hypothetical protein B0I35DRAFT_442650 [Stachybotrys elegans]|uniref:Fucose-specific lectin n=1 Tax=Stachybotrys elegans TaxID=80388 RepID=A0A8K0SK28_9HYPO|nr:hypothetical protein B0I35DRAFT_442650 [Stachybotrys elegans]
MYGETWNLTDATEASLIGNVYRPWRDVPDITLPTGAHFTAFKAQRGDDLTIFFLYLDENNDIQQLSNDGGGWTPSSPEVMRGVDEGTDIACINRVFEDLDPQFFEPPPPETNLARCYFQRGGHVVEVQLQSDVWVDLGIVPIP